MQIFREWLPAPGLERYVTRVWLQQDFAGSRPYMHSTVPHGSVELVCEVGVAIEAGFADQAHLSREALRLASRSPRAILREAVHHCRGRH
jgi:hypothetical protein